MMRLFAIDRLDRYARQRQAEGSKTWGLWRLEIAEEGVARLTGTMLMKLEAEHGHAGAVEFLKQKEGKKEGGA